MIDCRAETRFRDEAWRFRFSWNIQWLGTATLRVQSRTASSTGLTAVNLNLRVERSKIDYDPGSYCNGLAQSTCKSYMTKHTHQELATASLQGHHGHNVCKVLRGLRVCS